MAKEKLYEMVVIFDAQGDEADIRREIDLVSSLVEKRSSEFIGKADWGLRNFAYPIKKRTSGQYVYYLFRAGIEVPALLSSALKMDEKVLRYLIIRAKSNAKQYLEDIQNKAQPEAVQESVEEDKAIAESEKIEETSTAVEEAESATEVTETPSDDNVNEEGASAQEDSEEAGDAEGTADEEKDSND
ncbi:30S ribosomal protein S6 [bacterium]|nr:30S ribosomal protein S6 [bacterium]